MYDRKMQNFNNFLVDATTKFKPSNQLNINSEVPLKKSR